MDATGRDRSIGFICLGVTAFGWALNWSLMKLLLQQWPPLFARGLAGVCAALILAALARSRGEALGLPREAIPRLLFATFTNVFAWMGFGTMAMKFVTVGEGALIAYTMPIWAMLFAWPVLHTPPTVRDIVALVLGVAGVALLLSGNGFAFGADKLFGIALALSCAILFALGNVLNRVPMGVCYVTWFETLRRLPPTSASTGMLLVPVIGVVSAAIILGEPLGLREIAAMVLTLGGVTLALQKA